MATEQSGVEDQQISPNQVAPGFIGAIEGQYKKLKDHAEAYPYVWGSYTVVYGGLFLWTAYRWTKLRRTEDRVRILQKRFTKILEEEQAAAAATTAPKSAQSMNKSSTSDKTIL